MCIGLVAFAWQAKVARDQRDLAVEARKAEAEQRGIAEAARKETELALRVARDQRDLAVKAQKAGGRQRGIAEAARKETELALTESQGKTARMTYERARHSARVVKRT